ncbi:MAG: XrtA/PEP-CTERM system TPR-repeat protein PrsT [Thiobacillaceae bacterium]
MDPNYDLPSEDEYRPQPRLPVRLLIALAVTVATAALGGGAYYLLTRKDVDDYLRSAQIYLDKGDRQAAMIELKNALQRKPSHAEARFRLGRLHFSLQDYLAAEKELKLAMDQGHRAKELPLLLARTWLALGQPERVLEALSVPEGSGPDVAAPLLALHARAHWLRNDRAAAQQALEQAEALRAGDPEVLITRAMMAVDAAQPEQALALINQALGQDAKRADLWMFKGDLKRQTKQTAEAQSAYRKALELEPANVPARIALALTHLEANALDAAADELREAAKIAPDNVMVRYLQALIDFRHERIPDAHAKLQQVLKLDPGFLPGHLLIGAVNLALGNRNIAISHLTRVVDQVPGHPQARKLLAIAMAKGGRLDEATRLIADLKDSDDLLTLTLKGDIALRKGDPASARRYLEQATALSPDNPNLQLALAKSRMAGGDQEGAIEALNRAAELDTESTRPEVLLVQTHLQAGRTAEAMAVIDRLQKARPRDPLPHNLRGIAHMVNKDVGRARASFAEALKLDPTFLPAVANLARMDLMDNDPRAARSRFEAVLARDAGNSSARIALANLALADKDERAYLDHLNKAKQANAKDPTAYYLLARYWLEKRDSAKAIAEARAGLDATGRGEFHEIMGKAYLLDADAIAAANAFGKWVEATPDNPMAHYHLAEAQQLNGATADALRSLDQALALAPDLAQAIGAKATLLADSGRAGEGLRLATELQSKQPKSPAGFIAEAEILAKAGRHAEAGDVFVKAAELARDNRLALRAHESYVRAGLTQRSMAWLERWLAANPDDYPVRQNLALTQIRAGKLKEAAGHYEQLLKALPRNAVVANNLAWLYSELKDPRALQIAEQAHKLAPDNPATLDTLGWILVQRGEARRALQYLGKAHSLAPDAPEIHYHLAAAQAAAGDRKAALASLERLLSGKREFAQQAQAAQLFDQLKQTP